MTARPPHPAASSAASPQHPAPHRWRASGFGLLFGLTGAPAAWVALMSAADIAGSYVCYPHRVPLEEPQWHGTRIGLAIFGAACLLVALWALRTAYVNWQRTRHEMQGDPSRALDVGEGRTRFLSLFGVMSGGLFASALLFTLCALVMVPACKPWGL